MSDYIDELRLLQEDLKRSRQQMQDELSDLRRLSQSMQSAIESAIQGDYRRLLQSVIRIAQQQAGGIFGQNASPASGAFGTGLEPASGRDGFRPNYAASAQILADAIRRMNRFI